MEKNWREYRIQNVQKPTYLAGQLSEIFKSNLNELRTSKFYYPKISRQEAEKKLFNKKPGTFLVRDGSTEDAIYTVTFVAKNRKILNVRVRFSMGSFLFISNLNTPLIGKTVIELIEKQIDKTHSLLGTKTSPNIFLLYPHKGQVPSLKHLCRLRVNMSTNIIRCKNVQLKDYLNMYPYRI